MKESILLIVSNKVVIKTNKKQGERGKSYCNLMEMFVKIDTK